MAKSFFKRYIWLVDLLSRRGYIPFKEMTDAAAEMNRLYGKK